MIKYIHEMCKEHNCVVDLCICPDGFTKNNGFW